MAGTRRDAGRGRSLISLTSDRVSASHIDAEDAGRGLFQACPDAVGTRAGRGTRDAGRGTRDAGRGTRSAS
jgi:hypothetical protein